LRRSHPVSAAKFAEDETIAYQSLSPYDSKELKAFEQLTDGWSGHWQSPRPASRPGGAMVRVASIDAPG
jgi:hypothetical protein